MRERTGLSLLMIAMVWALASCGASESPTGSVEPTTVEAEPSTAAVDPTPTESMPRAPGEMPNFVGQQYDDAYAELAQYNVRVDPVPRISSEPAGTVIEQSPGGGAPFDQDVTLVFSTEPPPVPDVSGRTVSDAESELVDLGFEVNEDPVIDEESVDGLVIGQDPPAGTRNRAAVTLAVARRPVSVHLASRDPVETSDVRLVLDEAMRANGELYSHGISIDPRYGGGATVGFDLSREFRVLVGEVGLSNDSPADAQMNIEVIGDGRQLFSETLTFGSTKELRVDVTQVLRLEVLVSTDASDAVLVLGDWSLQGLPSEVTVQSEG